MKPVYKEALIYCILFVATHFTNKFVLSVLKFQFPTVFQGWQTLVGFLMLSLLITSKHLPPLMENVNRSDVAVWLPGMMLFVGSIYSGSKALAKLSMPVFMSLHNIVTVILCTGQLALYRQMTSLLSYMMIMVLMVTSILIGVSDPDFSTDGYFWMCVHILTTGAVGIYTKLTKSRLKLGPHERLYCNYLYSVIVLAPSSYFLGDAMQAGRFPYLFYSKFYMGCIMSGIFGVYLSLSNIKMSEITVDKAEFSKINGVAKLLTSTLSLMLFDITLSANHLLWVLLNHFAAIACEDSDNIDDTDSMPVFMSLHNIVTVILCTGQLALYRQMTSLFSYMMIMVLMVTSILIGVSDPDFSTDGYFWMCVHILTTGAVGIYTKLTKSRLKLGAHERLYCNYLYSVIVLAPSSYFLGDAMQAGRFPYLFYSKFYMGCIMSGIFGVYLSLSNIKMSEITVDKAEFSKINGIAKLLTSTLSLMFFDITLSANHLLWVLLNHLAAIACEDSDNVDDIDVSLPTAHSYSKQLTNQSAHTREFINISL